MRTLSKNGYTPELLEHDYDHYNHHNNNINTDIKTNEGHKEKRGITSKKEKGGRM